MSDKLGSDPAFNGQKWAEGYGLTKRELFAAMAMQGNLASGIHEFDVCVKTAVFAADALLAELEKKGD